MKPEYKQSLAFEEIKECVGKYTFSIIVEEDKEILELLNNPFVIALKCIIKQDDRVLGIGRSNSVLSQRNKYIKNTTLYTWNAAFLDSVSKSLKLLNELPLKADAQKEELEEEPDLEGRDKKVFYTESDNLKYASQKQKDFISKLLKSKGNEITRKACEQKLQSPYLSSYEASVLIKNLISK